MESKYDRLRQKYLNGIEVLRRKIEVLNEIEQEVESEEPTALMLPRVLPPVGQSNGSPGKFKGVSLTDALFQSLNEIGKNGATPPQLRDYMLRHGLETGSKHVLTTIATALARQVAKGKIRAQINGTKRHYYPIENRTLFSEVK